MTEKEKTFVHGDVEVKLTGRTAERELTRQTKRVVAKSVTLHEITPVDAENGSWKKWVRMTDLYEIKNK